MSSALRIASLLSSATEILYGLGLGEQVIAVSHECDYPPEATVKPRATFSRVDSSASSGAIDEQVKLLCASGEPLYEIDRPLLRELRPDLIVTQAQCDVCAVRYQDVVDFVAAEPLLRSTQVVALNPLSLDDVLNDIERIGAAADCIETSRACVARLRDRIERIQSFTRTLPQDARPRVAIIEWIEPLMLAANWTPQLIDIAGGYCPLTVGGQHSTYHSWNDVCEFDPEVLIVAPCGFDLPRTFIESRVIPAWPGFAELSATRAGRVWAVDGNAYFNRSGPRLVDSLEILAYLLHARHIAPPLGVSTFCSQPWQKLTAVP